MQNDHTFRRLSFLFNCNNYLNKVSGVHLNKGSVMMIVVYVDNCSYYMKLPNYSNDYNREQDPQP